MLTIYFDTNLFIYLIENDDRFAPMVKRIMQWHDDEGDDFVSSSFSLGEVLVHPFRIDDLDLERRYHEVFDRIACLPFGNREAIQFARLRAQHASLKPPDAIQLACAATFGVDLFVTNDRRLSNLSVEGIAHIISLMDWTPELFAESDDK
ncbi:MAG: PIN domain-containing protein [Candidatus Poribacteria bacterium]|nr:PIN domain-containing protein [Candidatus Poribacteria bacterium]